MAATSDTIPDLRYARPDGSLFTRIEMEQQTREVWPKVHWLRIKANKIYGLPKQAAFDMREAVLRHWVLDEMVRRSQITGDQIGVSVQNYNDDAEQRQFVQRLVAMIQAGQSLVPQEGEGIDMSQFPNPPPPPAPPGGGPPNGSGGPHGFTPPPPPPMPGQQMMPPPPPQMAAPPPPGYAQQGYAPAPQPQQGYAPAPQMQYPQQPAPQQVQQPQPYQQPQPGYPPVPPPQAMPPQYPQMPPPPQQGAVPPGPPQPGPAQAPAGRGRKRGSGDTQQSASVPPPPMQAAPVPPMQGGFPAPPPTGFAPLPVQQPGPQMNQGTDPTFASLAQKVDQLLGLVGQQQAQISLLTRKVELVAVGVAASGRAIWRREGPFDLETFLRELNVQPPQ